MTQNLDKMPSNPEAEEAVLGALMADRDVIIRVAPLLQPADFFSEERAAIYGAILSLYFEQKPGDLVTLRNELQRRELLGDKSGQVRPSYLVGLMRSNITPVHAQYYADIVAEMSALRELIKLGTDTVRISINGIKPAEVFNLIRGRLDQISAKTQGNAPSYFLAHEKTFDWVDKTNLSKIDPWQQKAPVRLRFGWPEIDGVEGFESPRAALLPQTLCSVLAYTNVGKTIFCQQVADTNARAGANVLYIHTELSHEQMVARRFNRMTAIPVLDQIMAAQQVAELSAGQKELMQEAASKIAQWPGRVDFVLAPNWGGDKITQIVKARHAAAIATMGRGYDLVVLDYLGRTGPAKGFTYGEKTTWMGHNVNLFGGLINELGIAGIMASQVSDRDTEDSGEWYPTPDMGSGSWTGDIERFSNLMIGITRQKRGLSAKFVCLKNTFGSKNWQADLLFDERRYLFTNDID